MRCLKVYDDEYISVQDNIFLFSTYKVTDTNLQRMRSTTLTSRMYMENWNNMLKILNMCKHEVPIMNSFCEW